MEREGGLSHISCAEGLFESPEEIKVTIFYVIYGEWYVSERQRGCT
jgi:hypothetical protein